MRFDLKRLKGSWSWLGWSGEAEGGYTTYMESSKNCDEENPLYLAGRIDLGPRISITSQDSKLIVNAKVIIDEETGKGRLPSKDEFHITLMMFYDDEWHHLKSTEQFSILDDWIVLSISLPGRDDKTAIFNAILTAYLDGASVVIDSGIEIV